MFYTAPVKKNISLLMTLLTCITLSSAHARMITRNADVLNDQEIYFETPEAPEVIQIAAYTENDRIVHGSTLLFLGGLAITEFFKNSSYNNTYKTGHLMQLFGGWGILFGSDNIISNNTPRALRIFAALCYLLGEALPAPVEA